MAIDDIDFSKIKSYNDLIEMGKLLDTEEEKVYFLAKYFENFVQYNYEQLFLGYLVSGIIGIENIQVELSEESFFRKRVGNKKTIFTKSIVASGENQLFQENKNKGRNL